MLRALDIRNLLLIDRLDLRFEPGLNVLTGETGAGKSILLDSLGFVLGWRGRAELVRQGAAHGEVVAEFDVSATHPARTILQDAGFEVDDALILRRVNTRDGRKTAWINDRRASGELLRSVSETLVELHGQHDDQGLLNPKSHRTILDSYGGYGAQLEVVGRAWQALGRLRRDLAAAEKALASLKAEEEFLRHAVAELQALDPQPGEDGKLDTLRRNMQAAESVRADIARARTAMGFDGAEGAISQAMRWLEGTMAQAGNLVEGPLAALERAMTELTDAQSGVDHMLNLLRFDPHELDGCEERLFAIRGLARKHQVAPDDLAAFTATLAHRLSVLDGGAADLASLEDSVKAAEATYDIAVRALTQARQHAARRLDAAMQAELAPLRMERAVFETRVGVDADSGTGRDSVDFTVATNPGAPAGALARIASGGELSRFLLALKVCLSAAGGGGRTMIFDEIDRGVGGATADAVGRRLLALAGRGQVLVVTHSPQVAALGAHHWQVAKKVEHNITTSQVVPLGIDARVEEIGRMLSGDTVTPEARAAARALLDARPK